MDWDNKVKIERANNLDQKMEKIKKLLGIKGAVVLRQAADPKVVLARQKVQKANRNERRKQRKIEQDRMFAGLRLFQKGILPEPEPKFQPGGWRGQYHFIKVLSRRGFQYIGSGAYSQVYGKENSDRVLKITRRPDGWAGYCLWAAQEGYAGKFAPQVYSYREFGDKEDSSWFSVAVVEKLKYTYHKVKRNEDGALFPTMMHYYAGGNLMAGCVAEELYPGSTGFLDKLLKKYEYNNMDLHSGNYMVREDGSPVLIDPVTSGDMPKSRRLRARDFTPSSKSLRGYIQ